MPSDDPSIEAGSAINVGNNGQYVETENIVDDCLTDPELCRKTGFTIGLWLKRKGKLKYQNMLLVSPYF